MFVFRVIGWMLYKPQPPTPYDKYQCSDVTIIVPTIDADEEAMCEAMRSWVLNEPKEILIVTVRAGVFPLITRNTSVDRFRYLGAPMRSLPRSPQAQKQMPSGSCDVVASPCSTSP
jgi:hypothetical protein